MFTIFITVVHVNCMYVNVIILQSAYELSLNVQTMLLVPKSFGGLMFPPAADSSAPRDGVFDDAPVDEVIRGGGQTAVSSSSSSTAAGGGVAHAAAGPTERRRRSIARGPIVNQSPAGLPLHLETAELPTKFISRKVHNTLRAPYDFEAGVVKSSGQAPIASLSREHVFGLRTDYHSGNAIYSVPLGGGSIGERSPSAIVYATAALGVVHRLDSNSQSFFAAHSDDITCLAMSADTALMATGSLGKKPEVFIWSVREPASGPIAKIGSDKYFSRAVCTVCFSYDSVYLLAMSCDDRHTTGIFKISSGALVCETTAGNGVPPQIRVSCWASVPQATGFISSAHAAGKNDLFVTAGTVRCAYNIGILWLFLINYYYIIFVVII